MPWKPGDAKRHTKRAKTDKEKKQWAAVANNVLDETGDEGRAVRTANAAVNKETNMKKSKDTVMYGVKRTDQGSDVTVMPAPRKNSQAKMKMSAGPKVKKNPIFDEGTFAPGFNPMKPKRKKKK